ncbi:hypothetical protein JCM10908_005009 [Rhodotorula pacifica]|uniref:glycosylphosphatidylinositol-alpha 1,4 mannosyltransferase I n=1 Tax=Rhodotorula pacifica TaxID=1495444 RepID=UPI0031701B82
MRLRHAIGLAVLLRVALLLWGAYQDAHSRVPYTDVDYFVFSDAAACILDPNRALCSPAKGPWAPASLGDPYARATYRYTPLVALLLVPSEWIHPAFGKVLFALADLLVGGLLYRLLIRRRASAAYATKAVAGIWLLNPIIANISIRGSSESIVGAIVVTTLACADRGKWDAAAALFGLAVHVKIFPFMYGSSLIAAIVARTRAPHKSLQAVLARLVRFGAISFACFMTLNVICYLFFGKPFVQETFLYHLSRVDHRHNFSPYFYPYYLAHSPAALELPPPSWFRTLARHPLAAFLPQLTLSIGLGVRYGAQDLPYAWLVQTFAFVTFNKVCTSQYFLWYLWLLPAALPRISMSWQRAAIVAALWVAGQAIWLSQAFRLEMLGKSVFLQVWSASVLFLFIQTFVLGELLRAYVPSGLAEGQFLKGSKAE